MRTFKDIFLVTILFLGLTSFKQNKMFYDFAVKDLSGQTVDLHRYEGKKILVVNVASQCGYTPQYKELEWLYEKYKDSNFVILAFPCNDFGGQEPGSPEEIKSFCRRNYGVTFPVMDKITVQGKDMFPLYSWLQHKSENGVADNTVKWNFNKFLINPDGSWHAYFPSEVKPNDPLIINWIQNTK